MTTPERLTAALPIPLERRVARAFEDAGAVSPASARGLAEIPGVTAEAVVPMVARRVVREGAPGRYYLHAGTEHAKRRAWIIALFVLVLALLPVFLLQFSHA